MLCFILADCRQTSNHPVLQSHSPATLSISRTLHNPIRRWLQAVSNIQANMEMSTSMHNLRQACTQAYCVLRTLNATGTAHVLNALHTCMWLHGACDCFYRRYLKSPVMRVDAWCIRCQFLDQSIPSKFCVCATGDHKVEFLFFSECCHLTGGSAHVLPYDSFQIVF